MSPAVDSHSISDFICEPVKESKQEPLEEVKEGEIRQVRHKISGLSRQASAAIEMASNHSMGSVLSPSVCLRQHLEAQPKLEGVTANHGSLGLYSDANHGSAFSAINNSGFNPLSKQYAYQAGSLKQSRPKILVHDGI